MASFLAAGGELRDGRRHQVLGAVVVCGRQENTTGSASRGSWYVILRVERRPLNALFLCALLAHACCASACCSFAFHRNLKRLIFSIPHTVRSACLTRIRGARGSCCDAKIKYLSSSSTCQNRAERYSNAERMSASVSASQQRRTLGRLSGVGLGGGGAAG